MAHEEHRAAAQPPRQTQTVLGRSAGDGEEIAIRSNGGDWLAAWHPPRAAPPG